MQLLNHTITRLLITFIGWGILYTNGQAQNISPSPNAAALESFSEVPVSLYTGIPSVNVPIYNLSSRHLSVPVSLNYHYTGLRPNEQTSWVGLGWALSAGGVITRTVRGKPDEWSNIGYYDTKDKIKHQYDHYYTDPADATRLANAEQEWFFLKGIANGQYDGQPDVYSFNVAGYTGKFFLDKQSDGSFKAYTIPYQNVKIEVPDNVTTFDWKIIVPNGTQYIFGGALTEMSSTSSTSSVGDAVSDLEYTSAWYLKEIRSMNGDDAIQFHYQVANPVDQYQVMYSEQRQFYISGENNSACSNALTPVAITATEVKVGNRLHIAKITTQTGHEVIFEEGAQRQDYSDKTLGRILVKSRTGELIKVVNFTYGYLDGGQGFKRLLLTKVQEVNGKQPIIAPSALPTNASELNYKGSYEFTYNMRVGGMALEGKFSRSIDHWGYYNGAGNSTLVPSYDYPAAGIFFAGANREVNHAALQAGVLLSINNPTGGTTTLDWEPNRYRESNCDDKLGLETLSTTAAANLRKDDPVVDHPNVDAAYQEGGAYQEKSIIIDYRQEVILKINTVNSYNGQPLTEALTSVSIEKVNDVNKRTEVFHTTSNGTRGIYLDPGTYIIKALAWAPRNDLPNNFALIANLTCEYKRKTLATDCSKLGPGIRIAKITYADGLNQKNDIVKTYLYQAFGNPKQSSGRLMMPIVSFQRTTRYVKLPPPPPGTSAPICAEAACNYINLSSNSFITGGYAKGSPICYTNVTVLEGVDGNNGRTDYYYSFRDDASTGFGPREDLDWLRGHLLQKRVYDAYGRELTRLVHHYEGSAIDATQPQFHQLIGLVAKMTISSPCNPDERTWSTKNVLDYATVNLTSVWHRLVRTESFAYFYDKGDFAGSSKKAMKTDKWLFYDNPTQHTFVTRTQTTDSEGRTVVTKSRYPQDIQATETELYPMATNMIGKHYLGSPMVSYTLRDNKILGASFQEYSLTSNNKLYATRSYVAEFNQPLTTEAAIFQKDAQNNYTYLQPKVSIEYDQATSSVLATTPYRDITSAVIWNSKNDLVIARAVNTKADEMAYTSFEETGVNNVGQWTITSGNASYSWTTTQAHTGMQSLYAESGMGGANVQVTRTDLPAGKYKVSFWLNPNGQNVSNLRISQAGPVYTTPQETLSRLGWKHYEAVVTLSNAGTFTVEFPEGVYLDELRMHPVQARMATFNHRPLVGLVSQTGANHQTVYYEYDGLKRLRIVKDFDGNIIKRHTYKYKKVD